jgi:L-asparaginase
MSQQKIKIFACGGTIDKVYFDAKSEFQVGEPQIVSVLREANVTLDFEVESILKKDSLDMTEADRAIVRQAVASSSAEKILITHGTDTIIETGKALLGIPQKTIVLTGSMEPAKFRVSDAVFNIGAAIATVQVAQTGVWIVMNGRIFDPSKTRKDIANNRFEDI